MKRRISLLIMSLLMMLNITSIYAIDQESQYCVYKINEESIRDEKIILDKATIDTFLKEQNSSYTYENVKIINELPYDIQLENTNICIPSFGELYFAGLLYNANALSEQKVYTLEDVFSYYQDTLTFYKSGIHGYVFLDSFSNGMFEEESQRVSGITVDLWQGNNLVDTCISNEQGYYSFDAFDSTLPYTLTIENMNDFILSKYNEAPLGNHFQLTEGNKVEMIANNDTHQNIGLLKKTYTIQYVINKKMTQKQYYYQDQVNLSQDNPIKDGYTFVEWNTQKDGSGKGYQGNVTFSMPKQNLTLYPIWKEDKAVIKQKEVVKEETVFTGDDSQIMLLLLLMLGSIAVFIVTKVLKKSKNR